MSDLPRCRWCLGDALYIHYHDHEWGKPLDNEHQLFELLCLEGQQAGLSWLTVLKKRAAYQEHFFQFSIAEIAQLSDQAILHKLEDKSLIRHKGKLFSIRDNAIAWQNLNREIENIPLWLWSFVGGETIRNNVLDNTHIPSQTMASQNMSKALKKHHFKFVGPTICYAFMQASCMVNDHENLCIFK